MTKSKTFVLERDIKGRVHILNALKGYDEKFWLPNKDAIEFSAVIKNLKQGDRIELKIVRKRKCS